MDWETVVPKHKVSYIMGNPPFVGAHMMSSGQKEDLLSVFGNLEGAGNLDYVTGWYKNAAGYMKDTQIRAAFVSTNSVTQGEQPAILWRPLMQDGIYINFGVPTFKWDSEATSIAAVHVVIIGFSYAKTERTLNQYLLEAPAVFIESRQHPLCDVPEIGIGNKPIDGGNYLFTDEEMREFVAKEPKSEQYFKKWIGSDEFINGYHRWCLWLGDCKPTEITQMPEAMKRVEAVRQFRLASKSAPTRKLADKPLRFHVENMPKSNYIVVPKVSSENRRYIPIGFMTPDIFASDLVFLIPDATLYHFVVLTSNVHIAWVRVVCGPLKSDYRYSKDIVYNNFPWPGEYDVGATCSRPCGRTQFAPTQMYIDENQKAEIEKLAQGVLDARKEYPESTLADMYGETSMLFHTALLNAHRELDKAVMKLYGFSVKGTDEAACVAGLMERYKELSNS